MKTVRTTGTSHLISCYQRWYLTLRRRSKLKIGAAGRYRTVLGKMVGDTVTPIGPVQTFLVMPLPERSW
ncbi:MAG: hypothetical protein LAP85_13715 [Acidobacteriia bacterium]|nr:hypothetical protein [Terriglobia bacterium]